MGDGGKEEGEGMVGFDAVFSIRCWWMGFLVPWLGWLKVHRECETESLILKKEEARDPGVEHWGLWA